MSLSLSLLTALLKQFIYHTIHPFKVYNSVLFLVYSQICATITTIRFRTFHHPKKEPIPFTYHPFCSPFPPSPKQLLIYFV